MKLHIDNIRLWDNRPLLNTYAQLQEIRPYYDFVDVDVDRYKNRRNLQTGNALCKRAFLWSAVNNRMDKSAYNLILMVTACVCLL